MSELEFEWDEGNKDKSLKKHGVTDEEGEERDFWAKVDLSDYLEADDLKPVSFPNLKPSSRPISIRMPKYLINRVKERANELNVPYQSLIKQFVAEGVLRK